MSFRGAHQHDPGIEVGERTLSGRRLFVGDGADVIDIHLAVLSAGALAQADIADIAHLAAAIAIPFGAGREAKIRSGGSNLGGEGHGSGRHADRRR